MQGIEIMEGLREILGISESIQGLELFCEILGINYITFIKMGVLITMLIIIMIVLFIYRIYRKFNRKSMEYDYI